MATATKRLRCAIYTRKSTEEGLDQEFNSLDAQYEACAAYVQSQKHEGWSLVKPRYDDGGISGGTLDRPALERLLIDIDEGRVDQIIVYKIDRLTRSLGDFTKIVERLDAKDASFVSVTQSFNTATSMGRLTLNMLLSFAQFEREVTSERIRDKIAASKAKGMWMGGTVPLGYEPNPDPGVTGLVVEPQEAASVRTIYDLYQQFGNLNTLEAEANRLGIVGKSRRGKPAGALSRGALHKILRSTIYVGKINHKGTLYEGRHEALIDQAQWDDVQVKLNAASVKARGQGHLGSSAALLKGKVFDETGDPLTPSHSNKGARIHRYYVSNRLLKSADPKGWRLSANQLQNALGGFLRQCTNEIVGQALSTSSSIEAYDESQAAVKRLEQSQQDQLLELISRVDLAENTISIKLDRNRVDGLVQSGSSHLDKERPQIHLRGPIQLKRRGIERKVIIGNRLPEPDLVLIRLLALAHEWLNQLKSGKSLTEIAKQEGKSNTTIRKRIPLALLSPKIQKAIVEGRQPPDLTADRILRSTMPINWTDQETLYGFA